MSLVVLLRDEGWPRLPGVCCWRHAVRAAFEAVGADVLEADGAADLGTSDPALVIAESVEAAESAVANGVSSHRVWALALPPEPVHLGVGSPTADALARVAPWVGGFLTDSEFARESVERATASHRVAVQIFPPLAADRPCPDCLAAAPEATVDATSPTGLLQTWRGLMERVRAGGKVELPYSFPAERLLGGLAQWAPARMPGWYEGATTTPMTGVADDGWMEWTAAAQDWAARAIWAAVAPVPSTRPRRTALVAGFDLKFAVDLAARLDRRADLSVTLDEWPSPVKPSERTEQLLDGAESIVAEWARSNAAWLANRKRSGQFLVTRLHRFELDSTYVEKIDIDKLDAVVHVSPYYGRRIRDELGWPAKKLVHIPNLLDLDWLDRPKLPGARFNLGMVGILPMRKRFDLVLDLLTDVRRVDPRFSLLVRSTLPWDYQYVWRERDERAYFGRCMQRIERDPLLRGAVTFDPPGADMARWYRRVGHVVSASDDESFHMAPAEGMASGAVPLLRPWPGAVEIYDLDWIHPSMDEAAAAVLANANPERWEGQAARAKEAIRRTHDPTSVVAAWADLLHGDRDSARSHFGQL